MESIAFGVGITATASVPEEWASKFLYNYNGRTLEEVMDKDVRGRIQNILTRDFGDKDLSHCQTERKGVYDDMRSETVEYFKTMGVQITNLGGAGGFHYLDESIQSAINAKFSSEMKVASSVNEVNSAKKFAAEKNAIEAQKMLDARINLINSIAEGIRTGKIPIPNTVGGNTSMLELYGLQNIK